MNTYFFLRLSQCVPDIFESTAGATCTHSKKGWRTRSSARKGGQYVIRDANELNSARGKKLVHSKLVC